ncbi:MAG: ABC transporter substrate-binding protein, partial [Paracoccaceae bacterium]
MISVLGAARKALARIALFLAIVTVAACGPIAMGGGPSINTSRPVPVALLVPRGSGNSGDAVLASSLENAARLAVADLDGVQIDLRVYDTAGQPGQAASVAMQAVNDGAKIILGPVYAETANAAGNAVASRGVNVLAFSNNTAIAGGNVFVLGPTFQNTANRLAQYAARHGRRNIMIVHGQDAAEAQG